MTDTTRPPVWPAIRDALLALLVLAPVVVAVNGWG